MAVSLLDWGKLATLDLRRDHRFAWIIHSLSGEHWLAHSLRIAFVLTVYTHLRPLYLKALYQSQEVYHSPVILWSVLQQHRSTWVLMAASSILLVGYKRLRWQTFEPYQTLRYFIGAVTLLLAWHLSMYDYNWFYDQAHYVDRCLLVVLVVFVWYHPAFVPWFVIVALMMQGQIRHPFGHAIWLDKSPLYDVLILFSLFLYLRLLGVRSLRLFVLLALCQQASHYVMSGFQKIRTAWYAHDHVANIMTSAYANGWLSFVQEQVILEIAEIIAVINQPLMISVIILQFGTLLICLSRRMAWLSLSGVILFHLGFFCLSGWLFWLWIALDFSLILLLVKLHAAALSRIFCWPLFWLSLAVMAGSTLYFKPVKLSWFNTGLNVSYELEAVGRSDEIYAVPRRFMTPYHYIFAFNNLDYLSEELSWVAGYGITTNLPIARQLHQARDAADVQAIEKTLRSPGVKPRESQIFDRFLQAYFGHLNQRLQQPFWLGYFSAPSQAWTFVRERVYRRQEPVKAIRVRRIKTFYNGSRILKLSDKIIRTVDIPSKQ